MIQFLGEVRDFSKHHASTCLAACHSLLFCWHIGRKFHVFGRKLFIWTFKTVLSHFGLTDDYERIWLFASYISVEFEAKSLKCTSKLKKGLQGKAGWFISTRISDRLYRRQIFQLESRSIIFGLHKKPANNCCQWLTYFQCRYYFTVILNINLINSQLKEQQ